MREKISEKHIRQKKINRIKRVGLKEIQQYKEERFKDILSLYNSNNKKIEEFDYIIIEYYRVLLLQNYLLNENAFNHYFAEYPDQDYIVYVIPIKDLNMWLEAGILRHYLFFMETKEYDFALLQDEFFTSVYNNFFSVLENILYDEKHKND